MGACFFFLSLDPYRGEVLQHESFVLQSAELILQSLDFVINVLYICDKIDNIMNVTTTKVQTAFRFDRDLIRRLKIKAKKENRSLNNYVETVLMDIVYDEPNDDTIQAIKEARSGKALERLDVDNLENLVETL